MIKLVAGNSKDASEITDAQVIEIIHRQLPRWQAACDHAEADTVILDQRAFGQTHEEILLLGLAIRYAGIAGKDVMIASGAPIR
jgi:hypothetical protein